MFKSTFGSEDRKWRGVLRSSDPKNEETKKEAGRGFFEEEGSSKKGGFFEEIPLLSSFFEAEDRRIAIFGLRSRRSKNPSPTSTFDLRDRRS